MDDELYPDPADWRNCPDGVKPGLQRWLLHGIEPGSFLEAVLKNNLRDAVMFADDTNIRKIPAIVSYVYNFLPAACWGSQDRYYEWKIKMEKEREELT